MTCYAQLTLYVRMKASFLNFKGYSYHAIFHSQDSGRQHITEKLRIPDNGKTKPVSFTLQKTEKAENIVVRFQVFLPTGKPLESKPFIGYIFTDLKHPKETKHELKLISANTENKRIHDVASLKVPLCAPAPEGLITVAYYHQAIINAGNKYGVEPQAIASIIFQEKYYDTFAKAKNYAAYYKNGYNPTGSFGLGEMQLKKAADLLGYPNNNPDRLKQAFNIITNYPEIALELVAKNILEQQQIFKKKLNAREATILHNAGADNLAFFLDPKNPISSKKNFELKDKVYNRSRMWQHAIAEALKGIVYPLPDNNKSCEAIPYMLPKYWKKGEGYSGL